MNSSAKPVRPLSPHLQVYRWQYTMALSILHRVTGCGLSAGLLLMIYWLVSLATGPQAYEQALQLFGHPVMKVAFGALSFAFFYHLLNGVRHLVWDTGRGLERRPARASGWTVFIGALVCTALFWFLVFRRFAEVSA